MNQSSIQASVWVGASEYQELLKDAARYRWLRRTTNWASSNGERVDVRNNPELWDAAIDDCIAKQQAVAEPRSVRLNDARWEKLKLLGMDWLADRIDRAKPPVLCTYPNCDCKEPLDTCGKVK